MREIATGFCCVGIGTVVLRTSIVEVCSPPLSHRVVLRNGHY